MKKNIMAVLVLSLAVGGTFLLSPILANAADNPADLKQQIETLNKRIAELEKQLAEQKQALSQGEQLPAMRPGWDPLADMENMQRQMNRMFQDSLDRGVGAGGANLKDQETLLNSKLDVSQTDVEYIYKMDLPGMDKDKINVEIKNNSLTISGERRSETEESTPGRYVHREKSVGSFSQTIPLPRDAKSDQITAEYKNGALVVKVGRVKGGEQQPMPAKKITIN